MAAMNGACLAFESNELLLMHGHDTHLLDRENDSIESNDVRQIGSRELQALTGLSADQLREWAAVVGLSGCRSSCRANLSPRFGTT